MLEGHSRPLYVDNLHLEEGIALVMLGEERHDRRLDVEWKLEALERGFLN